MLLEFMKVRLSRSLRKKVDSVKNFTDLIAKHNPGDRVVITTNQSAYAVILDSNPKNESKAYLGISTRQHTEVKPSFAAKYGLFVPDAIKWISGFLYWLFVLNLGIGLFNLLPLGPIDGGRMVKAALMHINPKKGYLIWKYISLFFFILVLFNVIAGFL
jgi:membrane-associated protease RseP (regulator of RpoE activity)